MAVAEQAIVATSHRVSTEIAVDTLRAGGNAVDAFVAASLADDLVLPGATSAAGLVGVLIHQARTGRTTYVHGPLQHSLDPARIWRAGDTALGKKVLLPGKMVALEEASNRFGKLSWRDTLAPVVRIAQDGFAIDHLYASAIANHRQKLVDSAYGRATFFRDRQPLAAGELLRLPETAMTLSGIAERGAGDMTHGVWARAFVDRVHAAGGNLTMADLAAVRALVAEPLHGTYRGHDVYACAGASFGGAKAILALDVLGRHEITRLGHPSQSVAALELLLRVEQGVEARSFYTDPAILCSRSHLEEQIAASAAEICQEVAGGGSVAPTPRRPGSTHSSAVVVYDSEGTLAAGAHTIETVNWGDGLFVGGIPLSTAAPYTESAPDGTVIDPLSAAIVLERDLPRVGLATYGSGLHPADVQLLSSVIDFGLDPEEAVLRPRAGWLYFDPATGNLDPSRRLLDPRFSPDTIRRLEEDGFQVAQEIPGYPIVDTGFATLVTIDPDRAPARLRAMTPMWMTSSLAAGY